MDDRNQDRCELLVRSLTRHPKVFMVDLGDLRPAEQRSGGGAKRRRRGRPRGSGYVTEPEVIHRAYHELRRELGRRPTQQDLARKLGVHPRTLQRAIRNLDMPWPPEA